MPLLIVFQFMSISFKLFNPKQRGLKLIEKNINLQIRESDKTPVDSNICIYVYFDDINFNVIVNVFGCPTSRAN